MHELKMKKKINMKNTKNSDWSILFIDEKYILIGPRHQKKI
jgi:hypothetical protein